MDDQQILHGRQIAWLSAVVLLCSGLIGLLRSIAQISEMDTWTSFILPAFYGLGIAAFFAYLSSRFPGKHIFEIIKVLCGTKVGIAVNILLIVYIWMLALKDVRAISTFLKSTLLPRTPEEITMLLFILVIIFYTKSSIEITARVNDLMFPLFLLLLFVLPLILLNELSLLELKPILTEHWNGYWGANWIAFGNFGDILVFGAFLHTITVSKQLHAGLRHGIIMATFVLTLLAFLCIAVLGPFITGRATFPSFSLVRQIHITDFLDRVEIVVFSLWFPIMLIKCIMMFAAILIGLSSLTGSKDYRLFNRMSALFLLMSSFMAFSNQNNVFIYSYYGIAGLTILFQVPFLAFLAILLIARKRKQPQAGKPYTVDTMKSNKPQRLLEKIPDGVLRMVTNAFLLVCFLCIVSGLMYAKYSGRIGVILGFIFVINLFLSLISSSAELIKSNRLMANPAATLDKDDPKTAVDNRSSQEDSGLAGRTKGSRKDSDSDDSDKAQGGEQDNSSTEDEAKQDAKGTAKEQSHDDSQEADSDSKNAQGKKAESPASEDPPDPSENKRTKPASSSQDTELAAEFPSMAPEDSKLATSRRSKTKKIKPRKLGQSKK